MADLHDGMCALGPRILDGGTVPGPPDPPWQRDRAYPLAVDVDGRLGAVSFAVLDMLPDIALGWWCLTTTWSREGGDWREAGGESDHVSAPTPFERPVEPGSSVNRWCDWHTNDGAGQWGDQDDSPWRHTFSGIAPVRTGLGAGGEVLGSFLPPWTACSEMILRHRGAPLSDRRRPHGGSVRDERCDRPSTRGGLRVPRER